MRVIRAGDVRIPRSAREALANHEEVVVLNRDRPTMVIVNADDRSGASEPPRRGRPLREALAYLLSAPLPDEAFERDMEAVLLAIGGIPADLPEPSTDTARSRRRDVR